MVLDDALGAKAGAVLDDGDSEGRLDGNELGKTEGLQLGLEISKSVGSKLDAALGAKEGMALEQLPNINVCFILIESFMIHFYV